MNDHMTRTWAAAVAVLAISLTLPAGLANGAEAKGQQPGTLTVEVAETGSQFTPDEHFVDDNGVPTRGNYFITDGYLYDPGTLTAPTGRATASSTTARATRRRSFPTR